MAWLTQLGVTTGYPGHILPSLIAVGFGLGLVFPTAANLATFQVAAHESGTASATMNTSQQVGASLGSGLLNAIAAGATANYLATHRNADAQLVGLVHGYTLAGAALVTVLLVNARLDGSQPQQDQLPADNPDTARAH